MPELPPLVVVGAGALGREAAALVEAIEGTAPAENLIGFVDDDAALHDRIVMGYPVLGDVAWLAQQNDLHYVVAIGDGNNRYQIVEQLDDARVRPSSLVHPSVPIHRTTTLGAGTILCNGAAPTVDVAVGPHVVVDQHCTVGHDCVLDAFVTLHPGVNVSGSVHLERTVTVGSGAVILPETTVGANATVGAGAVVTEDLPPNCTAVGVPARPLS